MSKTRGYDEWWIIKKRNEKQKETIRTSRKICWFMDYTSQQDFGTGKIYCVSNVTFHAESKYAIKIFPSPTVFVQWSFKLLIFRNFWYFHQWFFYTWTIILNGLDRGWSHTIYRYHISSCLWSDTGSERDNETNVESWRIELRAFRPAWDL